MNDFVPTINNIPFGANVAGEGFFWAAILEKAWAKIWGSYEAITDKSVRIIDYIN